MIWKIAFGIFYTYHIRLLSAEVVNVTCNAKNISITYLHCSTSEGPRRQTDAISIIQRHQPLAPHSDSGM